MKEDKVRIIPYNEDYRNDVLRVWEASVLATHDFLSEDDFQHIKTLVQSIDFYDFKVFLAVSGAQLLGFIGVLEDKVEMLFIEPTYTGFGLGKELMGYAIKELGANKVDVNEQNRRAVSFYEKLGFEAYERTNLDDQGNPYPLLRMSLFK